MIDQLCLYIEQITVVHQAGRREQIGLAMAVDHRFHCAGTSVASYTVQSNAAFCEWLRGMNGQACSAVRRLHAGGFGDLELLG